MGSCGTGVKKKKLDSAPLASVKLQCRQSVAPHQLDLISHTDTGEPSRADHGLVDRRDANPAEKKVTCASITVDARSCVSLP